MRQSSLSEKKLKDDEKFIDEIKTVLKNAKLGFTNAAGDALHRLDETQPTIETVKELIDSIPNALSFKNENNRLPIQSAVFHPDAVKYVPTLAKVGIKHEFGGRGMRGGLLAAVDPISDNGKKILQLIVNIYYGDEDPIPCDCDTGR